jgi:hypothetical protein
MVRTLTLTIKGAPCGASTRCVELHGALTGTIRRLPNRIADVGQSFEIKASGTVNPFGMTTGRGTAHGTGFIFRGQESLTLTLVSSAGKVTLTAYSRTVPGFTSP